MNSNSFNMRRLIAILGADLSERKRTLLLQSVMLIGLLTIAAVYMAFTIEHHMYKKWQFDPSLRNLPIFYILVFFMAGCLSASFMFNDLATKEGRIRSLMRPALDIEKFTARWLIYIPGFIVVFSAGVFIAESLRTGIVMLRFSDVNTIPCYAALFKPAVREYFLGQHAVRSICNFCLLFLAIQSFFVLGSTIWPKNSALKTFAVFFGLAATYSILSTWTVYLLCPDGACVPKSDFIQDNSGIIMMLLMIVAIATNYILAWLRLGETDVITTRR